VRAVDKGFSATEIGTLLLDADALEWEPESAPNKQSRLRLDRGRLAQGEPEPFVGGLAKAIDELLPGATHDTRKYANNRVEADHGRLKARLRGPPH